MLIRIATVTCIIEKMSHSTLAYSRLSPNYYKIMYADLMMVNLSLSLCDLVWH